MAAESTGGTPDFLAISERDFRIAVDSTFAETQLSCNAVNTDVVQLRSRVQELEEVVAALQGDVAFMMTAVRELRQPKTRRPKKPRLETPAALPSSTTSSPDVQCAQRK